MNSSPIQSWEQFTSRDTGAIYTFFDSPWVIKGICFLVLAAVVWFIVASYRFEGRGRDRSDS
ncbi:MAG: hypothetical protein O2968_12125 [Acidobacteria bacterium]|nr:hypothetical protein [Acidobacteriota bacterium]